MLLKTDMPKVVPHTDEDRKNIRFFSDIPEDDVWWPIRYLAGSGIPDSAEILFMACATEDEKKELFEPFADFHEKTRSFALRVLKGYTPFLFDIHRGKYGTGVAYANSGADDHNSSGLIFINEPRMHNPYKYHDSYFTSFDEMTNTDKQELDQFIQKKNMETFRFQGRILTPSLMLASQFCYPTKFDDPIWHEYPNTETMRKRLEDVKDLLYTYAKLKKQGLDLVANEGWLKRQEKSIRREEKEQAEHIRRSFQTMDNLLKLPENERFDELEPLFDPTITNEEYQKRFWEAQQTHNYKISNYYKPHNSNKQKSEGSSVLQTLAKGVTAGLESCGFKTSTPTP